MSIRAESLPGRRHVRPKITHCTFVNDGHRPPYQGDGRGAVAEFSSYAYYNSDKFHFYGEDFMKHTRWLIKHLSPMSASMLPPVPIFGTPGHLRSR